MQLTPLSDDFATTGQISVEDVASLHAQGFAALLCARPDGESEPQPSFAEIAAAAARLGMKAAHVPVARTGPTDADHAAFAEAMAGLSGPVLGYCLSGKRAGILWQAHQSKS